MVTRQTLNVMMHGVVFTELQWRPGMVTRQTWGRRMTTGADITASMEAGNGYPANPKENAVIYCDPPASMEAGNGYPANPGRPARNAAPAPRFNGGREWLPGKLVSVAPGELGLELLQWRPGMVTRQT